MINWLAGRTNRMLLASLTLFTVVSCGGGGGGGGDGGGGFIPDNGGDTNNLTLLLDFIDFLGNPTSTVTSTTPATLQVYVSDRNDPAEGVLVTASTTIGIILPESGTALTDSEGVATFRVEADGALGAGTIEVSVDDVAGAVTDTINIQIEAADLRLGNFRNGMFHWGEIGLNPDSLSSGGSSQITVAVVDADDQRVNTVEMVNLSSECLINGQATVTPGNPIPTVNGQIMAVYTVGPNCSDQDFISASLDGDDRALATADLFVAPSTANSISFASAAPMQIALKGTGGGTERQERARVTFEVIDSNAAPIAGINVSFALSTETGGLSLENTSGLTDGGGLASAFVTSGNVATSVRVIATIEADDGMGNIVDISTISDALIVSTGLPDQNSISLSSSIFTIPGGFSTDGVTATLTVRMADKFNNPVPNGTSALFSTEYGSIQSSCITTGGTCFVTWSSQEPRFPVFAENRDQIKTITDFDYDCPSHNGSSGPCPDFLGGIAGGRSTVQVTAIGEEFFADRNGNGLFDLEESEAEPPLFENLPEAFLDHNEDFAFTPSQGPGPGPGCAPPTTEEACIAGGFEETFSDFNNDNEYNLNVDPNTGKGVYNGTLCPVEGDGVWCSRELVHVRDSVVLTLSADTQFDILLVEPGNAQARVVDGTFENRNYIAYVADIFNNPPAADSTITVSPEGGCVILSEASVIVPLTQAPGAFGFEIRTDGAGGTDSFTIKVASPGGNTYSESFFCKSFAPVDDCDLSPQPPECATPAPSGG